jgi:hypothetical protein
MAKLNAAMNRHKQDGAEAFPEITEVDKQAALDIIDYISMDVGQKVIELKSTKFDAVMAGVLTDQLVTIGDIESAGFTLLLLPEIYYDRIHKDKWAEKIKDLDSKKEEQGHFNEVITVGICAVTTHRNDKNSGAGPGMGFSWINSNGNICECYTDSQDFGKGITNFIRPGARVRVHGYYMRRDAEPNRPNDPQGRYASTVAENVTRVSLEHIGPETVDIFV